MSKRLHPCGWWTCTWSKRITMGSRRISTSTALPSVHCAWAQLVRPFWAAPSSWRQQAWGGTQRKVTVASPWGPKQTHVHLQRRCAPEAWWVHNHIGHRLGRGHTMEKRERWPVPGASSPRSQHSFPTPQACPPPRHLPDSSTPFPFPQGQKTSPLCHLPLRPSPNHLLAITRWSFSISPQPASPRPSCETHLQMCLSTPGAAAATGPFIKYFKRVNVCILSEIRVPQPCLKPSSGFLHLKFSSNDLYPGPQPHLLSLSRPSHYILPSPSQIPQAGPWLPASSPRISHAWFLGA